MDQENDKLYTPTYVKAQQEYFPGFGKKELKYTAVMSIFVVLLAIILWIIKKDIAVVILTIMIGVIGSIIVNTKNEAELSMVYFVGLFFRYMREQQLFLYEYKDEWKI